MYFVLKDQEVSKILDYIGEAKKIWLLLGGVLIFTFITLESLIIHYLLNSLSCVVSRIKCLKYSFVGFFVSLITPSASGGQPAQMYYMKGDGIGIAMSSLVLMIVTIAYKAVLIIMAAFLLLFDRSFLLTYISGIEFEGCYYITFKMEKKTGIEFVSSLLAGVERDGINCYSLVENGEIPIFEKYDNFIPHTLLRKAYATDKLRSDETENAIREFIQEFE